MEFQHKPGHIYVNDLSGNRIAEVTFPISEGVAVIDRTYVDKSLRGQGIADRLLSEAVAQIRSAELKARPTCTYAIKWFAEHPEHADLL